MTASIFPENKVIVPFSVPAITSVIDKTYPPEEHLNEVLSLISGLTNRDVTGRAHDLIMGDKELLMLADAASDDVKAQLATVSAWKDAKHVTDVTFNLEVYEGLA
ncbi:MAG: hypothetical protein GY833_12150 [Aestuariibacter sp.]|nr:hypothetical protein [Aestuariibacter sp.]|tara:strand:+ start:18537 stop:18851 length:315 start_codon:yes stop_codon:yes gene_type:complete